MSQFKTLWAAEWHEKSQLDGERRYILWENLLPALFRSRKECREFIKKKYGYISTRQDLRQEPFGWRMPQPVKVKVVKLAIPAK